MLMDVFQMTVTVGVILFGSMFVAFLLEGSNPKDLRRYVALSLAISFFLAAVAAAVIPELLFPIARDRAATGAVVYLFCALLSLAGYFFPRAVLEKKQTPNQSLEPTPTAVTPPAAQEPRRP
jgi:hypothetical protein